MVHQSVGLTMRKLCGELECPEYHLCQIHDLQCYPCQSYCNQTSHNYDVNICERQCQDYIHDYIKHYIKPSEIQGPLQDLEILKFMMISIMVLMIVVLVLISIMTAFIWNRNRIMWKIKNEGKHSYLKKKLPSIKMEKVTARYLNSPDYDNGLSENFRDNTVSMVSETTDKPVTRAKMMATQTSRATVSSSKKFPCEDITLETQDFTGYDNLGMWNASPVFSSKL